MKDHAPYIVEFKADGSIEEKKYPPDCTVGNPDQQPIIVITHDKSIFLANDGKTQAWICDGNAIFCPKEKRKSIMVSDFLLRFS